MFPENMHVYAKNEMKALKLCLPIEKYVRAFLFPVINIFCHKHILFIEQNVISLRRISISSFLK